MYIAVVINLVFSSKKFVVYVIQPDMRSLVVALTYYSLYMVIENHVRYI